MGTSGFDYRDWRGPFYPPGLVDGRLAFYARRFRTVELNVTFYRMPAASAFRDWAAAVPPGFLFAVKASRYLTHVRRLRDPRAPVDYLVERASLLGDRLGPILLQLPPDLPIDLDRLDATLRAFPPGIRLAVEPRHASWFVPGLEELLRERGAALVLADRIGPLTPPWRTAPWTYLRLHEGRATPRPCYGLGALRAWRDRLVAGWGPDPDAYVYFNNDPRACAVRNAATFERLMATAFRTAPERTGTPAGQPMAGDGSPGPGAATADLAPAGAPG